MTRLGIVMHRHEPKCHAKRLVCYFQGQGHSQGSYDQNMTVSTISSELLLHLLTKLGLIVHFHKPDCLIEKLDCCVWLLIRVFCVLVFLRSRSQQNFKMLMFVQMIASELLNLWQPNLVLWWVIVSQIVFQKDWFAVFKVGVIVKDHIIKIWLKYVSWTADPFATN